ncbi:hypothetical protein SLEP1_g60563 [Rubroshorea leprosula]|uniref:Uncharacterized protein n=1 Tax=Rubroshorea leprosula TaxID=152421 RepID=A0AAV5MYX8_9ROSI|nr:hypothetical protein SLEP1_g60563 [Rubroshorea leprosula]
MLTLMRSHERCWLLKTAGRWPWKLETAKECVTTHLPKQLALKMDGAQAWNLYPTVEAIVEYQVIDLGGSSKYSSENLEDQCGEGFHVNSS